MKSFIYKLATLFFLVVVISTVPQTNTFPSLTSNNVFTGTNIVNNTLDGQAPVTITTTASCTLGTASGCASTAYNSGYTYNQEATAATAITYTLPTPVAGKQYCVKNSYNGSAADTGTIEILVANTGSQSIIYNGAQSSSGYIISAGAAGDAACVVAINTTEWETYVQQGSWTLH